MAKQRYVFRKDENGVERLVPLRGALTFHKDETIDNFDKRILRAHYEVECEQGSRFKSAYSKDHIKRTWEGAIARGRS